MEEVTDEPQMALFLENLVDGMRKDYAGMVEAVDAGVGQLMAAIDKHQLAEDTLFVVTNDNGGERLSDNGPFFLFDLASDPGERKQLGYQHAELKRLHADWEVEMSKAKPAFSRQVTDTVASNSGVTTMRSVSLLLTIISASLAALPSPASADADDAATVARAANKVRQIIAHRGSSSDRPENTLASYRRAIEVGALATECDVRTTKDGVLVSAHDADVSRTSTGKGRIGDMTLAELKRLDFGSRFDPRFKDERLPTLQEVLELCKGKIDVMLDLKETGAPYAEKVAALVRKHGEPKRVIVGVRSVEQARSFRKLLPESRQIGLIPTANDIEAFAEAGVETIRLWPKWLDDKSLVPRVRKHKKQLHLGAGQGTKNEVLLLLRYEPESLSSDDPGRLLQTLTELGRRKP